MENPYYAEFKSISDLGKSQKAFCRALAKAMVEGVDPASLSVSDICRLANFSRTTFYANYTSVSDVQNDLEEIIISRFATKFNSFLSTGFVVESFERTMREYLQMAENELTPITVKMITGRVQTFYDKWTTMLKWRLYGLFSNRSDKEIILGVYVNAIEYGIKEYLENKEKFSIEILAKCICDLYKAFQTLSSN